MKQKKIHCIFTHAEFGRDDAAINPHFLYISTEDVKISKFIYRLSILHYMYSNENGTLMKCSCEKHKPATIS